jgi:hypothetical protein
VGTVAAFQHLDRLDRGGSQRRRNAEQQTHEKRQDCRADQRAPVHCQDEARRVVRRIDSSEDQRRGPLCEPPAGGGGGESDDRSLHHHQLREAPTPRAERDAQRHFPAPGGCLPAHQVGDVRTGNQQDQYDEYAQSSERSAVTLLHHRDSRGRGLHGERTAERIDDRAEVVTHRRGRYTRLQVHKGSKEGPLWKTHPPMHGCRQEEVDHFPGLGAGEARSRHTYDLIDASARDVIGERKVRPTICGSWAKRRDQ